MFTKIAAFITLSAALITAAEPLAPEFEKQKKAVVTIARERVLLEPYSYRSALKSAEEKITYIYRKAGIKPPSERLDKDIKLLKETLENARQNPTPDGGYDSNAELMTALGVFWDSYKRKFTELLTETEKALEEKEPFKSAYWSANRKFDGIKNEVSKYMEGFSPVKDMTLQKLLSNDHLVLLTKFDKPGEDEKTELILPEESSLPKDTDFTLFFKPLGSLPNRHPEKSGSFTLPPGTRTPVRCENRLCTVYRISQGRSIIVMDGSAKKFKFGYFVIPEKSIYRIKNVSDKDAVLDYIAVRRY